MSLNLRFCIVTALLINISTISAQNKIYKFQCTYKLDYQPDSTDRASKRSENMFLFLNENSSLFKSENLNKNDSVDLIPFGSGDLNSILNYLQSIKTNFKYTITMDSSYELIYTDYIDREVYEYRESNNSIKWEISGDSATINGYHCQKATTVYGARKWTAWFTPDIAISDGPYKFNGLPGLIIKIYDSQGYYTFTMTSLLNIPEKLFTGQYKVIKIDKAKFYYALSYFINNQYEMMAMRGIRVTSGEDAIRNRLEERRKKNNNPIEIVPAPKK